MGHADSMLLLLAALGAGINAGFFFAFSILIMPALDQLPTPQATHTMQTINRVVLNPWFFGAFFGTALLSLTLLVMMTGDINTPRGQCALAASLLFLLGVVGVTMVRSVPLNNELARHQPDGETAGRAWARYVVKWTRWNHVRTIAPAAACIFFILALAQPG
jgi:uncharacterized membrane protein